MLIEVEVELNRGWIVDNESGEAIGETNFVVSRKDLVKAIKTLYPYVEDKELFLEVYCPEIEGQKMYEYFKANDLLKEDKGEVYY